MLEHPGVPIVVECRVMRFDGTYAYVEATGVNLLDDPIVGFIVVNAHDTTQHRLTDPLTGLSTRVLFVLKNSSNCRLDGVPHLLFSPCAPSASSRSWRASTVIRLARCSARSRNACGEPRAPTTS